MSNIFEDYISSNSPVKIDNIYEYQDRFNSYLADANYFIKSLKDIDPDKALYYAELALRPNPVPIINRTEYKTSSESNSGSFASSNSVDDLPFKGRRTVEGFSLDNTIYWDIRLKKYINSSSSIPENPFKDKFFWFPIESFEFSGDTPSSESLNFFSDLSVTIPKFRTNPLKLSFTVTNDSEDKVRDYYRQYMDALFKDNLVLPYKESLTEITMYILDLTKKIKIKKTLLCIPDYTFDVNGSSDNSINSLTINYNIVGEINYE